MVLHYSVLLLILILDTLLCRHHPLLGEFRSNSMSGGRPSVVSKTNIGPSNSFGGGGALLYNNTSTRHNSHKVRRYVDIYYLRSRPLYRR